MPLAVLCIQTQHTFTFTFTYSNMDKMKKLMNKLGKIEKPSTHIQAVNGKSFPLQENVFLPYNLNARNKIANGLFSAMHVNSKYTYKCNCIVNLI